MLEQLKSMPDLEEVDESGLQWLVDNGEVLHIEKDGELFKPGDPIDRMYIMLEGNAVFKIQQGNQYRVAGEFKKNTITGLLPYSRAKSAVGLAQIVEKATILSIHRNQFHEMITTQESLTTALVHLMSTRIREFTKRQQQDDKMMALGKLSAGLAHELNNPSAAIVRSAQILSDHLKLAPDSFKKVVKMKMSDDQVDGVNEILSKRISGGIQNFSMMEKSEREDDIVDWLDDRDIADSDEMAENLVDYGFTEDDLDEIEYRVEEEHLESVINWINQNLTTERLVDEIEEASQRINELVSSVKSYTHMDQAPDKKSTDIHIGIENTLKMLAHKINRANISVKKDFDETLPQPKIFASEMNQVWTNIIDNAIDAMADSPNKELGITTSQNSEFINVVISDSGSGIPEEIQGKIFDPFFTTKEIGQGTGLGMEVVNRIITNQHNGSITFKSEPGKTEFTVCFPLK